MVKDMKIGIAKRQDCIRFNRSALLSSYIGLDKILE